MSSDWSVWYYTYLAELQFRSAKIACITNDIVESHSVSVLLINAECQHLSCIAIPSVLVMINVALFFKLYETHLENGSETCRMLIIATWLYSCYFDMFVCVSMVWFIFPGGLCHPYVYLWFLLNQQELYRIIALYESQWPAFVHLLHVLW